MKFENEIMTSVLGYKYLRTKIAKESIFYVTYIWTWSKSYGLYFFKAMVIPFRRSVKFQEYAMN